MRWWYWSKVFQHNHWRKNYKYTLRRKSQYMGAIISRYLCSKTIFVNALTKMVFKQSYLEMIAPLGRKNNKMRWENFTSSFKGYIFFNQTFTLCRATAKICAFTLMTLATVQPFSFSLTPNRSWKFFAPVVLLSFPSSQFTHPRACWAVALHWLL